MEGGLGRLHRTCTGCTGHVLVAQDMYWLHRTCTGCIQPQNEHCTVSNARYTSGVGTAHVALGYGGPFDCTTSRKLFLVESTETSGGSIERTLTE